MKKKIFALEQVLTFRKEVENTQKLEFAVAKREFELADDLLRRDEEHMDRLNVEYMDRQLEGIYAIEMQLYADFFRKKESDIKAQRHVVTCLDEKVGEKRELLLDAAKEKKVLEGLKEKKIKAHNKAMADKDMAFLDEVALRKGNSYKK
jgi:flagellar FliJ protein